MAKFYRLESPKDQYRGIYNCGVLWKTEHQYQNAEPQHPRPEPWSDPELNPIFSPSKHIFGFASLEQLTTWFNHPEDYPILEQEGIVINVYDAPTVIASKHQAITTKDFHLLWNPIATIKLTELTASASLPSNASPNQSL